MHPVAWDAHVQHKTSDSRGFPLSLRILLPIVFRKLCIWSKEKKFHCNQIEPSGWWHFFGNHLVNRAIKIILGINDDDVLFIAQSTPSIEPFLFQRCFIVSKWVFILRPMLWTLHPQHSDRKSDWSNQQVRAERKQDPLLTWSGSEPFLRRCQGIPEEDWPVH